uniref:Uncharacterized protein n=1 Tax=Anguilla anguilla TaxID=7936 RepID=A0A0E9W8V4_ANGAN
MPKQEGIVMSMMVCPGGAANPGAGSEIETWRRLGKIKMSLIKNI